MSPIALQLPKFASLPLRSGLTLVSLLGLVLSFNADCLAQGTTTSSAFGARTLGGSSTGPTSSSGSQGQGGTAGAGAAGAGSANSGSSMTGSERYLRQNRTGAFVGADKKDSGAVGNAQSGGNNQQQQQNMFQNMFSQMNRNRQNQQSTAPQTKIRIPLKLAFKPAPTSAPKFQAAFDKRLVKLPGLSTIGPIQTSLHGTTVVLRGKVATEEDRQLAEKVALLEPEVWDVQNELEVDQDLSEPEELPAQLPATP